MKNVLLTLFCVVATLASVQVNAQIKSPAPSPAAKSVQTIGMTEVVVEYSRPSAKEREIFGDLVPYGKMWRTGANAATKVSFSGDVTINGTDLKKGDYALFTKPNEGSWEVMLFDYTTRSAGGYGKAEPVLVTEAEAMKTEAFQESFLITFDNLRSEGGTMDIIWANTKVSLKIGVNSHEDAMASIKKTLAGPTAGDYYAAGSYMASRGEDLETALSYIQKATQVEEPKFWQVRQEAEVLAKLGNYKEAIKAAKKSMELAEKAGNADYVAINKKNIAKWKGMK